MRGGARAGAGRPKLNHIRKTFYLEKELFDKLKRESGKTESDKINLILKIYFNDNIKM